MFVLLDQKRRGEKAALRLGVDGWLSPGPGHRAAGWGEAEPNTQPPDEAQPVANPNKLREKFNSNLI